MLTTSWVLFLPTTSDLQLGTSTTRVSSACRYSTHPNLTRRKISPFSASSTSTSRSATSPITVSQRLSTRLSSRPIPASLSLSDLSHLSPPSLWCPRELALLSCCSTHPADRPYCAQGSRSRSTLHSVCPTTRHRFVRCIRATTSSVYSSTAPKRERTFVTRTACFHVCIVAGAVVAPPRWPVSFPAQNRHARARGSVPEKI